MPDAVVSIGHFRSRMRDVMVRSKNIRRCRVFLRKKGRRDWGLAPSSHDRNEGAKGLGKRGAELTQGICVGATAPASICGAGAWKTRFGAWQFYCENISDLYLTGETISLDNCVEYVLQQVESCSGDKEVMTWEHRLLFYGPSCIYIVESGSLNWTFHFVGAAQ